MIFLFAFLTLTVGCAIRDLSTKNALKSIDADILAGYIGLGISIALLPYVLYTGIPSIAPITFLAIIAQSALYFSGKYCNFVALKIGDLSYISPLKGIVAIAVIFTEFLLYGIIPTGAGILGVILVFLGVYVLNVQERKGGIFGPVKFLFTDRASQLYLVTAICYSFTAVLDKIIVQDTYPVFWVCLGNFLLFVLSLKKILQMKAEGYQQILTVKKHFFMSTGLNAFTQISQMYIVNQIFVSYMSSFKAASGLLAVLLGGYFLQEKNITLRLAGALVIFLGIIVISFFGG